MKEDDSQDIKMDDSIMARHRGRGGPHFPTFSILQEPWVPDPFLKSRELWGLEGKGGINYPPHTKRFAQLSPSAFDNY